MLFLRRTLAALLAGCAFATAQAQDKPITLVDKKTGDAELAEFTVDTAPGTVSAAGMIGADGIQMSTIENSRDLTVLLRLLDGGNATGIAFAPARSALLPMNVSTYDKHLWARAWAGTTFAYAQGVASISDKRYRQRALSVETTFFLEPQRDDPLVVYWRNLTQADKNPNDPSNPCLVLQAERPAEVTAGTSGNPGAVVPKPAPPELADALTARANACHQHAITQLRWNASRVWLSLAGGTYTAEAGGGSSQSLGRTAVLGLSYGFGDADARYAGLLTVAARRSWDEPTLATYDAASPTRKSTSLVTLRGSLGGKRLRGLVEASNKHDGEPAASQRTYKRAVGLDLNFRKGMWLNLRAGKQRRVDNSGDETGGSIGLSISPDALLTL